MKRAILALAALAMMAQAAHAGDDKTPIVECDNLPSTARIEGLSEADTINICQGMMLSLDGSTISDLRAFSKLASRLVAKGYRGGDYGSTASDLVYIIVLRGLYDKEPRWGATIDLIWDLWFAEKVTASPLLIGEFLSSVGPKRAKSITDDELIMTMITLAE